jgi:hypothetical protein
MRLGNIFLPFAFCLLPFALSPQVAVSSYRWLPEFAEKKFRLIFFVTG